MKTNFIELKCRIILSELITTISISGNGSEKEQRVDYVFKEEEETLLVDIQNIKEIRESDGYYIIYVNGKDLSISKEDYNTIKNTLLGKPRKLVTGVDFIY